MSDDVFIFEDEISNQEEHQAKATPWQILIVDDDEDVHTATTFALKDSILLERPLSFYHAYSSEEAIDIIKKNRNIALILLDVVMETDSSGLNAVKYIREQLGIEDIRIILRTGQPGQVPELDTIAKYDINDYKTKSELTKTKLTTAVIASLRAWQQIKRITNSREGLEKIINASNQFIIEHGLQEFAEGVIIQMAGLFNLNPEGIVCVSSGPNRNKENPSELYVIAAAGQYRDLINKNLHEINNIKIMDSINKVIKSKSSDIQDNSITVYFHEPSGRDYAIWIGSPHPLKKVDKYLLEVFCTNLSLCAGNIELVNKLRLQAYEDPILKIPNMSALLEELKNQIEGKKPRNDLMIILDIDGFGEINNLLGYEYGDNILKAMVKKIKEIYQNEVFIARVSADSFAILCDISQSSQDILEHLSIMVIPTPNGERELTVSIGAYLLEKNQKTPSSLLRNGYVAMKRAKGEGTGQIVWYDDKIGFETKERIHLLQKLKYAIPKNQLFLTFQPQMDISTRKIFSCEVLLRWKNDKGDLVPPDKFIKLAEQSGLIIPIGNWIIKESLVSLKKIHEAGFPEMNMAINVSAQQLKNRNFISTLDTLIQQTTTDPKKMELEITESISIIGIENILKILGAIRERGISLAVDDFGTGYSSLSSIDRWPVKRIKIDRTFIKNMDNHKKGARLVDLVIPLGEHLDMKVLAEGVENLEQFKKLQEIGCNEIQGYYISKPRALEDFIVFMKSYKI